MGDLDQNRATTTDFTNQVPDFIVDAKQLDAASPNQEETFWYFDKATTYIGYYLTIPEIFSAVNALATWAFGRGYTVKDELLKQELEHITGMGKDTFDQLMWNHEVMKVVVGDSFIHIKKQKNVIVNMIPISPERIRLVFMKNGLLKRYDTWDGGKWTPIKKEEMLHSANKRLGDSMHGQTQVGPAKWIIDARNEALADERIIKHRDKALGIAYYKTNNAGKITFTNTKIEKAVKDGEMLGLPEGTVEIKPYPSRSSEDRTSWISYLENFFYQVFGVPRSIATSDGTSEVGGKMGHVIFEPIYVKEQKDNEGDLWVQQGIEITWNRPPSLGGLAPSNSPAQDLAAAPPTIQPNDVEASLTRE